MVNHAHLCVSNHESIYPILADPSYDPTVNTVAVCARSVPLLWFGLFRPINLVRRAFETDDGPYIVIAPIARRKEVIANLEASLPRLSTLFTRQGHLEEYVRLLTRAVSCVPGDWVTIEWDEIAVITQGDFLGEAAAAMASLDPAAVSHPEVDRARLLRLSGINRPDVLFPPAVPVRCDREEESGDAYVRSKIIGIGYSGLVG